ncbi:MAG: hypothetical protein KDD22_07140 [Bdellovibrionales bacterium]|nr:hypothetical protein [Bdellovibrionales bacterium]
MSQPLHFRRCHVCDHVTQSDQTIMKCEHCHKSLAPFFYFDEKSITPPSDLQMRPKSLEGEYSPIQGLTAYWDGFK